MNSLSHVPNTIYILKLVPCAYYSFIYNSVEEKIVIWNPLKIGYSNYNYKLTISVKENIHVFIHLNFRYVILISYIVRFWIEVGR